MSAGVVELRFKATLGMVRMPGLSEDVFAAYNGAVLEYRVSGGPWLRVPLVDEDGKGLEDDQFVLAKGTPASG